MILNMHRTASTIKTSISTLLPEFDHSEFAYIEPGLLEVFRLYTVVLIIINVLVGIILSLLDRGVLTIGGGSAIFFLLLLVYLYSPRLRWKLKQWYLPIGLAWAAIVPFLPNILRDFLNYTGTVNSALALLSIIGMGSLLHLNLLVLLDFVAWQYSFRTVTLYTVAAVVLNLTFTAKIGEQDGILWPGFFVIAVSIALLFLLIGYIISTLISLQRARQEALIELNTQLIDQAATVEQLAISRERNRMARDLHDTLAHTLSSVVVQMEAVDSAWDLAPDKAHSQLLRSLANARGGLDETRRALNALRSAPLDDLGLALAIRTMAETAAIRNRLDLKLDMSNDILLPEKMEQNFYRVAQEAVTNVVDHAKAKTLSVSLKQRCDKVVLTVKDDGIGFDSDKVPGEGHYGIQGMRERAMLCRAILTVESKLGKGTTVRLEARRSE